MTTPNNHTTQNTTLKPEMQAQQKADGGESEIDLEIEQIGFDATYSVEDNKLRLYADTRFSAELYELISQKMGFRWAPKQDLFVAPKWTPNREDFCIKLAGEITAEGTTLVERAEAKAERLDNLSVKRAEQASAFHAAADRISERFAGGQPILIGHHSERKARKDQERMTSAMDNAVKAHDAVSYWAYRATSVELHANRKSAPRVRAKRIKTLLAELRDRQRDINNAYNNLKQWETVDAMPEGEEKERAVLILSGYMGLAPYYSDKKRLYRQLEDGEITSGEVINICIDFNEKQAHSAYTVRWISHLLNRLDYERSELGDVARFEGELTPVILQAFAREHGAQKPKAQASETGFNLSSSVPLPFHIAESKEIDLSIEDWRELMQSVGYAVIIKERRASTKQACPLINPTPEQAQKLQAIWNRFASSTQYGKPSETLEVSQKNYSVNSQGYYGLFRTISIDKAGDKIRPSRHKDAATPVCRIRVGSGKGFYGADRVITLSDKPQKELPLDLDSLGAESE